MWKCFFFNSFKLSSKVVLLLLLSGGHCTISLNTAQLCMVKKVISRYLITFFKSEHEFEAHPKSNEKVKKKNVEIDEENKNLRPKTTCCFKKASANTCALRLLFRRNIAAFNILIENKQLRTAKQFNYVAHANHNCYDPIENSKWTNKRGKKSHKANQIKQMVFRNDDGRETEKKKLWNANGQFVR